MLKKIFYGLTSFLLVLTFVLAGGYSFAATAGAVSDLSVTGPVGAQAEGTTITFTAQADGNGSTPEYQFWQEQQNGTWHIVQNYSTINTFTLSSPTAGSYPVTVYALDADQISANDWQAALTHTFVVNVDATASLVVPTSSSEIGQPISLTATSKNLIQPVYQFWIKGPDGNWIASGNYSSTPAFTFTPTTVGSYELVVYAKDPIAPNTALFSLYDSKILTIGPGHAYLEDLPGQPYYTNGLDTGYGLQVNQSMTMAGTRYSRGIYAFTGGTAQANFLLNRNYANLAAIIGLDDSDNANGATITFSDQRGQTLATYSASPGQVPQDINVPVAGVKVLIISINESQGGQLDLANPVLTTANQITLPPSNSMQLDSNERYLEDLPGQPYYTNGLDTGYGLQVNQSMTMAGTRYSRGIYAFTGGTAQANFLLNRNYANLAAIIGLDDSDNANGATITFSDQRGQTLATYSASPGQVPQDINVPVAGVKVLIISINESQGGQLDLANPILTKSN